MTNAAIQDLITEGTEVTYEIVLDEDDDGDGSNEVTIKIRDCAVSLTTPFVLRELAANQYGLNGRRFEDGSVILDIGANVGVVSIFLAKQLPNCTIYAVEPMRMSFANLLHNIKINGLTNIVPINAAVTADGRNLTMHYNYDNLGGASGFVGHPPWNEVDVVSITLQGIFETHCIDRVALLKMDCEGGEHEILASCNGLLDRVDFMAMEAHFSNGLRAKGYNQATLQKSLQPLIARKAVQVTAQEVPG